MDLNLYHLLLSSIKITNHNHEEHMYHDHKHHYSRPIFSHTKIENLDYTQHYNSIKIRHNDQQQFNPVSAAAQAILLCIILSNLTFNHKTQLNLVSDTNK